MNTISCQTHNIPMIGGGAPHSHNDYEIIYHLSGKSIAVIGNENFNIDKGDITILPPGVMHSVIPETTFTDAFLHAKRLNFARPTVIHDNDNTVLNLMNMLQTIMLKKEENYEEIADNLLATICSYINKYLFKVNQPKATHILENIILKNYTNPNFNLAEAIRQTGYNKDYLRRQFCAELGKTPHEYMINLKIRKAKVLLEQNYLPTVKYVSQCCGFSDNLYFSTVFKKATGLTPTQYRNKSMRNLSQSE